MKWKRLKDGTLQSSQATIMKNAEGSYIAIVSQVFQTEKEARAAIKNNPFIKGEA